MLLPYSLQHRQIQFRHAAANLPLILYAGIAASIVGTMLWMRGLERLGANRASIFINLMPVFTTLIAVFLVSEALHAYHLVGGGVPCGMSC